jgi:ubiquinone biosynthesis protein COQ4
MSYTLKITAEQQASHDRLTKFRWRDARDALRRSMADPDDTAQVIRFIGAVAGKSSDHMMKRFIATPQGGEILERERSLLDVLLDREALYALPDGTLGRTYAEWTEQEQISATGLKEASEAAAKGELEDQGPYTVLGARVRDMHDLMHVVTGYGRDLVGEVGLLTFTYAQTRNRGVGLIGYLRSFFSPRKVVPGNDAVTARLTRSQVRNGLRRGRNAKWIVGADWEALLAVPLDEVRRRYGIGAPPVYQAIRSAAAPDLDGAVAG